MSGRADGEGGAGTTGRGEGRWVPLLPSWRERGRRNADLEAREAELVRDYRNLRSDRDQLRAAHGEQGAELGRLREDYRDLERHRDLLRAAYDEQGAELGRLREDYRDLERDRDLLRAAYDEVVRDRDRLAAAARDLESVLSSVWWRLTAPARVLAGLFGGRRGWPGGRRE